MLFCWENEKIIKGTFEPRHLNTFPRRAARERLYLAGDFSLRLSSRRCCTPIEHHLRDDHPSVRDFSTDQMWCIPLRGYCAGAGGIHVLRCAARTDTTHTTICTLLLFIIQRGFWWGCKRAGRGWKWTWTMSGRIDGSDIFMHHHAEFFLYGETKS
jgi:hypothetical protein